MFWGNVEIVKMMIEKGANEWNGELRKACSKGNEEIASLMINQGANYFND